VDGEIGAGMIGIICAVAH